MPLGPAPGYNYGSVGDGFHRLRGGWNAAMAANLTLDARGLQCPLPVLRARKAMRDVPKGGTLEVLATDPSAVKDFQAFCAATGHDLIETREEDGVYAFLIGRTG